MVIVWRTGSGNRFASLKLNLGNCNRFNKQLGLALRLKMFNFDVNVNPRENHMNELVQQVADQVGIDPATAEKAIGMMLAFLKKEAPGSAIEQMLAAIPGANDLAAAQDGGGGGLLGSLLGGGGIMGLGQQLMGAGLGMGEITGLAKQTIAVARQHAGDDVVDQVVASVPGLSQFV